MGAVAAQDDECPNFTEVMAYGDEVTGDINDDHAAVLYCFQGDEGDEIVIDAETIDGDLDPYLLLSDIAIEKFYTENNDISSRDSNSRIEYTLEFDSVYVIAVTRVGGQEGKTDGEFSLRLEGSSPNNTPNVAGGQCPQSSNMMIAGYSLTASLDDEGFLRSYCFFGLADTEYRITVETTEDDLDPMVIVTSPDFEEILAENDNANSRTTDARIDFVPEEDGVYRIIVTRQGIDEGNTTGQYLFSLDNRTTDEPDACADELSFPAQGVEIERMEETYLHVYCFNGTEDGRVTFTAEAQRGNLDMIAFITEPNLDTVEQGETKTESMELTATVPQDGPYFIIVFDLTGTGRFDMTFEGGSSSSTTSNNGGNTLDTAFGNNNNGPARSGDCESQPLSFLIEGNWSSTNSTGTTEMKFDCDGNVSVTINGSAFETTYFLENDTLTLAFDDGDLVVQGVLLTRTALIGTTNGQAFMMLNRTR